MGGGEGVRDQLTILSGTGQNIVGLAVFVVASFGMNILIARAFGEGSRPWADHARHAARVRRRRRHPVRHGHGGRRRVAIEVGRGEAGRSRAIVGLAVRIALAVSVAVGAIAFLLAKPLADLVKAPVGAYRMAAVALVFVAVAQVYLGGSRGLKIMRHTLYAYWIGQSVSWIVFTLLAWAALGKTVTVTVGAYAVSWLFATLVAWWFWRKDPPSSLPCCRPGRTRPESSSATAHRGRRPRCSRRRSSTPTCSSCPSCSTKGSPELSVYAAAVRVAQALVLFLTAVSYMFSPFVADLHERGERDRLNALFKSITRWTLAGTVPLLLLFYIAPEPC